MPQHRRIYGRVTIRLLINESGNLAEVQIVRNSGDGSLDQSVVFASKQSSFPLPPQGATVADRTFLVTYIYN
jgi:TonB family protein